MRFPRLPWTFSRELGPRLRLAVYRWTEDNAGDVAVQRGIESHFPSDTHWEHIGLFEEAGDAIARVNSCDGLVIGGGTILGNIPTWLTKAGVVSQIDVPVGLFGTGLRDEGFEQLQPSFAEPIVELLERSVVRGVRGDLSRNFLERSGVRPRSIEVVGDAALSLSAPQHSGSREGVAFNIRPRPGGGETTTVEMARRILSSDRWRDFGPIRFFSCHNKWDLGVGGQLGVVVEPYRGLNELFELLSSARVVVSERLHGSVLAHLADTPAVQLSYERKCLDYMGSVGAAGFCTDGRDVDHVLELAAEAISSGVDCDQVRRWRLRQRANARQFLEFVR